VDAVEIANLALGKVGANSIASFEEDSTEAELVSAAYDAARDAVLAACDWLFASRWVAAERLAAAPVSPRHAAAYAIPTEAAVVREATDAAGGPLAWVREGDQVLTEDAPDSVRLRITSKETDPALYAPGFVQALGLRLAAELAVPLAENRELQADCWALYARELKTAKATDGRQGTPERRTSSWLRNARR
jgi:hypothetical protein